jgi:predicted MPP superfamily phosphohydrolase
MLARLLIFLAIALAVFVPCNWIAYRQLVRTHPRRRRWVVTLLVAGNLMWPFIPFIRSFTPFSRVVRATLGPVWFGWTTFTFLYAAFSVIVLLAWLPFRRRATLPVFARWPSRIFLALLIGGFVVGCYQALVPLRVEHVRIPIANLPASLAGTRVAVMGDLHVGLFTRPSRLQTIFATASSLQPRAILLAGDLIDDDRYYVPKLLAGAKHTPGTIPILAVYGNHEMYGDPLEVQQALRGSRIRLLVNEGAPLGQLWIAGVSDYAAGVALRPDLDRALLGKPPVSVPFVLAHQPKVLDDARRRHLPVAVCAHTHGGQLGFRPLGWSLAGVFLPYHMGLYDVGGTRLYVNTGTGYWLFPFRLGMTPEITLIELVRA